MKAVHEEVEELLSSDDEDRFSSPREIRKKAMDFLARREYGQAELARKLADKGYRRSVVEEALATLSEEGLQSDTRFAESFVQSRINQGKGPVRIRADLGQRGIRDGIIEAFLRSGDDLCDSGNGHGCSPLVGCCLASLNLETAVDRFGQDSTFRVIETSSRDGLHLPGECGYDPELPSL